MRLRRAFRLVLHRRQHTLAGGDAVVLTVLRRRGGSSVLTAVAASVPCGDSESLLCGALEERYDTGNIGA
jgi:hypothetical protein